jgi:hypothetical protein
VRSFLFFILLKPRKERLFTLAVDKHTQTFRMQLMPLMKVTQYMFIVEFIVRIW